ncbi:MULTISPECIES: TIR domain-containing protein [unclassified Janthinobacterium]|uniref:TIR domain-containing protein n=1 Tax=unclassified Janthinobacterium TaxID=2610881 RepID=UPI0016155519|nr:MULTISPECIES: nucleotide-binding protein [unclassified Janthinobacterium]
MAHAIHSVLDHNTSPTTWPHGTFSLSNHTIEDLVTKSSDVDFAVFIFHPDDVLESRGESMPVVRDNVIFELGLFIGAIGRQRCYIVKPRAVELHLPSDLLGINPADYDPSRIEDDADSAVVQACTKIRAEIKKHGLLEKKIQMADGSIKRQRPNPPEIKLNEGDIEFLGIAAATQVSAAGGLSSWHFANGTRGSVLPFRHELMRCAS